MRGGGEQVLARRGGRRLREATTEHGFTWSAGAFQYQHFSGDNGPHRIPLGTGTYRAGSPIEVPLRQALVDVVGEPIRGLSQPWWAQGRRLPTAA